MVPGSAFKKKGVQRLLDCVVNYLPEPDRRPPDEGPGQRRQARSTPSVDDKGKLAGLAFKLWTDPFVGKLVFFRVYTGKLKRGMSLYNPRTRRSERVSRLVLMRAIEREEIDVAYAGDICALVGVKDVITGDTLCDEDFDIRLEPPSFPEPVISMSIEPNTKADQEKMGTALQRLVAEDPTLRVSTDPDSGQTILSGMGELHLDIIRDRMKREFKVEATSGKPQIAYRETVTKKAEGEGKFIRQSGGKGQYGHVVVTLEPERKGQGRRDHRRDRRRRHPEGIHQAVDRRHPGRLQQRHRRRPPGGRRHRPHRRRLLPRGRLLGARVQDGRHLRLQGRDEEGQPDPARADHGRRGHDPGGIPGRPDRRHQPPPRQRQRHGEQGRRLHHHRRPCRSRPLFGYVTDIRSLSKGRASASITPSHFEQVPNSLLAKIVESSTKAPARS